MKNILVQKSGFTVDFAKMMGDNRLQSEDFVALSAQIQRAHANITKMRNTGLSSSNELVLFPTLPYIQEDKLNSPTSIQKILDYAESLHGKLDAVVNIGIGGSYLGARVLTDGLCGLYWNTLSAEERQGYPQVYFTGNNLDAEALDGLQQLLMRQSKQKGSAFKIALLVVSKSGTTMENAASFMSLYNHLSQADNICLEVSVITQSDPKGKNPLENLAKLNKWPIFRVPEGIGGRFCALADPGLLLAALMGLDIKELLRGARDMQEACTTDDIENNAALLLASCKYLAREKHGKYIEVFMPYCEKLKALAEWYVQLLAESLGKKYNQNGQQVHYSRTPLVAVGSTDMHAQTQEHQEGMNNKVIQFVRIQQPKTDVIVPDTFKGDEFFKKFVGLSMNEINDIALKSNANALNSEQRFSLTVELPELNAYFLGALMYCCMLSIAYEGELAQINAFDQPGVEVYKSFMRAQMRDLNK